MMQLIIRALSSMLVLFLEEAPGSSATLNAVI